MGYGGKTLPVTGAVLALGGTSVTYPMVAAIGAVLVVGGFLIVRFIRPARNPRA